MDISSYMAANLSSIQQTASMSAMRRAMGTSASSAATMLMDFQTANPTPPPSGHRLDVRA